MCSYPYVHVHIHLRVDTRIHVYSYMHIHTRTRTHTHTSFHVSVLNVTFLFTCAFMSVCIFVLICVSTLVSIWEFPKMRDPSTDPKIVGLVFQGPHKKDPYHRNSHIVLIRISSNLLYINLKPVERRPKLRLEDCHISIPIYIYIYICLYIYTYIYIPYKGNLGLKRLDVYSHIAPHSS